MIFQNNKAFNFLKKNGFVFTFREGRYTKKVRKVWIRRSRNGEKEFDAYRVALEYGFCPPLYKYAEWSGFGSASEWVAAIRRIHGRVGIKGTIYLVFRV